MLILQTFSPFRGTLFASPFACKADALLQMAGLPYEREFADVRKAPKGKLPVLKDGEQLIPDSDHIRHHLERVHGVDFDGHMNDHDRAIGVAAQRVIEQHAYFINMHFRWSTYPDIIRDEYFADVPGFMRGFVFNLVAKQLAKTVRMQGLGRHSEDELREFLLEDFAAISQLLADRPFFGGEKPSSYDAAIWGALHGMLACNLPSPGKTIVEEHSNLVAYEQRFRDRVYGDGWPEDLIGSA
ncbi:glutathione S-transferase family protein [Ahrensia sp. R2A130]|uniref:glutathione S-transferase family protein n=1 Tax=Ahrensia sp. R2A130 TaxID=744979 RepID=UPI0001E0D897|nr:glutathione S-transferase family protein [Ahrensia sp. R2A130]EFL87940.1 putative glutathione S-transferase [Ahrensia sp. R2A130]